MFCDKLNEEYHRMQAYQKKMKEQEELEAKMKEELESNIKEKEELESKVKEQEELVSKLKEITVDEQTKEILETEENISTSCEKVSSDVHVEEDQESSKEGSDHV